MSALSATGASPNAQTQFVWDRLGLQRLNAGTGLIGTTATTTAITIGRAGIMTTVAGDLTVDGALVIVGAETFSGLITITSDAGAGAAGVFGPEEIQFETTQAADAVNTIRNPGYIDWEARTWETTGSTSTVQAFGRLGAVIDTITAATGVPATYRLAWASTAGVIQWDADEAGNTLQQGTLSVSNAAAVLSGTALTTTGAFTIDPTTDLTIEATDNRARAFAVAEGARDYLVVDTEDAGASMAFGNATTNPTFDFLGTGVSTFGGRIDGAAAGVAYAFTGDIGTGLTRFGAGDLGFVAAGTSRAAISATRLLLRRLNASGVAGTDSLPLHFEGQTSVAARAIALLNEADPGTDTYRLRVNDDAGVQIAALESTGALTLASTLSTTGVITTGQAAHRVDPFGAAAGNTGEIRFLELAATGANYVAFKAPDAIAANIVWTLPSADATVSGAALQSNAAGVLSWTAAAAVLTTRIITSGGGLTGGGDLSADRTLAVGAGTLITVNADDVALANGSAADQIIYTGAANIPAYRLLTALAGAGLTTSGAAGSLVLDVAVGVGVSIVADAVALDTAHVRNVDHSAVSITAGTGLSGGGDITVSRTLDVGAGIGISVAADSVAVDQAFTPTWTGLHVFDNDVRLDGAGANNGQTQAVESQSELVTLSTLGATTDTAMQVPANTFILGVDVRCTTTVAGVDSTGLDVGDATTATRFISQAGLTAGNTAIGLNHLQGGAATDATGPVTTAALTIRLTLSGGADNTPTGGVYRVTVRYITLGAATS